MTDTRNDEGYEPKGYDWTIIDVADAHPYIRKSLRDEFAIAALSAGNRSLGGQEPKTIARDAYKIADAMLAAREGGQS